ncbi:MAG: alpha/beta hydrolase [Alphaproteobacteria bacterium]|nr:alpha/beta hydrolase [Alphaproteobacteria bacterium]
MTNPDLEPRFLEPPGWQWGNFHNAHGKSLRYGYALPKEKAEAAVIILPGRSEFIEKYFETAQDLLKENLAVWIMDWQGQGGSERLQPFPEHGRSPLFEDHVRDLNEFIFTHVKTKHEKTPLLMLAQSMGGNIGLRYLHTHPGVFSAAALMAPMLGIKAVEFLPPSLAAILMGFFHLFIGEHYAFGEHDWTPPGDAPLSSDPVRGLLHNTWFAARPELVVGGATWEWLHYALSSCACLRNEKILRSIKTPCLIARSGHETLIDNAAIARAASFIPGARLMDFAEAHHEILMERDKIRGVFLQAFLLLKPTAEQGKV